MIKTVQFQPWHLDLIKMDLKENFEGDHDLLDRTFRLSEDASTFIHTICFHKDEDFKVLGIIGGTLMWHGAMEVFSVLSRLVDDFPIGFTKEVLRILEYYEENLGIRRFQAAVRVGFASAAQWIRTLGFGQEALMQKFGPEGDDYFLFARIR